MTVVVTMMARGNNESGSSGIMLVAAAAAAVVDAVDECLIGVDRDDEAQIAQAAAEHPRPEVTAPVHAMVA